MAYKRMRGMAILVAVLGLMLMLVLTGSDLDSPDLVPESKFSGTVTTDVYASGGKATDAIYQGSYAYYYYGTSNQSGGYDYSLLPLSEEFTSPPIVVIENGRLTIDLGTPNTFFSYYNLNSTYLDREFPSHTVNISNPNAKMRILTIFDKEDGNYRLSCSGSSYSVRLFYVDSDVTITGSYTEIWYTGELGTRTYALNLKQGWNYVKDIPNPQNRDSLWETAVPGSDARWFISSYNP
jgi:hypothetical protein